MECNLCEACIEACPVKAIKVIGDEENIIFTIETTGSLSAEDAFYKSIEVIREKVNQFVEELKKIRKVRINEKNRSY